MITKILIKYIHIHPLKSLEYQYSTTTRNLRQAIIDTHSQSSGPLSFQDFIRPAFESETRG
jgi:hypothetical protein